MTVACQTASRRLLIVDDNPDIHADVKRVLAPEERNQDLESAEAALFGVEDGSPDTAGFDVSSAAQGQEAMGLVEQALAEGRPYSVAIVDMRMPPGWDGLETIERLWEVDASLQVIICSAYSDHSPADIRRRLGEADGLLILSKPFKADELAQMVTALSRKWELRSELEAERDDLEQLVCSRTEELQAKNAQLLEEISERERVESDLRVAHKLEAVGQLAAGIAHEINTPIQFVSDSLSFLSEAFDDLGTLRPAQERALAALEQLAGQEQLVADCRKAEEDADLEYLDEHVPKALGRCFEGVDRVSKIVRAMKEFAHPGTGEKENADLSKLITNMLTVARNEYKYCADVTLELGELPPVPCLPGDLGQVLLNLVVNGANSIEDVVGTSGERGTITIKTWTEESWACISVTDTGAGIPDEIQERIFELYFTTKEVGRGSGQGLALARTTIVEAHGGELSFESEVGVGTTFLVKIPLDEAI